ncbi:hypothetical protein BWI97_10155 [Siphonobacter sp. BAB-5405]|uniref:DUF2851 family protein n=1 Tax=Siphonobacter sp. BAB-5405 TaxID=1864825 RepID=UPI000C7FC042|nr:DUF2851 family protein [Siphonobacter sp. BAB-5405]PMD97033.1 hypothetical protein BWI97_10155 [Siphonobacter sp. BAB-5405]
MTEDFIHYLWQFQQFDATALQTETGDSVQVISPGKAHQDAGPDFQQARIRISTLEWVGTVEIHTRSSDWFRHTHETDAAYENVILHVVWIHDAPVYRTDGTEVPTLCLQNRTDPAWLDRYQILVHSQEALACSSQFLTAFELHKRSMLDRTLIQRLSAKAEKVRQLWEQSQNNWEETTWQILARSLGSPLNAEPLEWLARTVPLRLLHKHRNQPFQVEALLFGCSGLIPATPQDAYTLQLQREAYFLLKKYELQPLPTQVWKFLRLRPASFPTVRIAQLVPLVTQPLSLFSFFINQEDVTTIMKTVQVSPSEYWQQHYTFHKPTEHGVTQLGQETAQRILINAVVPLLVAYGHHKDEARYTDRAIERLEQLPAEQHAITKTWKSYGLKCQNAADSQGALEWMQTYCQPRKCLSCSVGLGLLKR